MKDNYVVIMAGGIGSRFWPFSRVTNPKQFHDILGTGRTMIQQTVDRFEGICPKENIYIVTNEDYFDLVKLQLPQLSDNQILLEPMMRNTAPCIAYACYKIAENNPNANIVVAPADHVILKEEVFKQRIKLALRLSANDDSLVTLGIEPTRPDTGYGYIQMDLDSVENEDNPVRRVKIFTEKPTLQLAQEFISSGEFVWNAGIFIWNVQAIISHFKEYLPEIHESFTEIKSKFYTNEEKEAINEIYPQCQKISIDYGIMEKAKKVYVVKSDLGWSDLGTWKSLYEQSEKDSKGNVIHGQAMLYETKNTIIKTPAERLVVVQGLENCIVVEYDNVLLICNKDQEQRIKDFVEDVKKQKGENFL